MKRFQSSSQEKGNPSTSLSSLDMRFFNMNSQETLNSDIDMNSNKITNLKDGTEDNDAVNKQQLDYKVDIATFASLSRDVQWLMNNHLLPSTYNTQIQQLVTRLGESENVLNNVESLSARLSGIEAKLLKINTLKTIATKSKTGYITDQIANDHLLFEVSTFTIILPIMFTFNTSNTQEWHDLQHHRIRGVLGYAYVKIVDDIERNKKKVILHTFNDDWMRKSLFTNYYSLRYTFEYITTENVNINILNDEHLSSN